ncbi:glycosyltransferase [Selenomonas artemidis]|uniref:glycosyltransferase n=1 Tax=Selenomonas artemidis TaxID=671224 RepID=UPI0003FCAAD6|nr:glycosyltransferase [Selenomonas artemidis]
MRILTANTAGLVGATGGMEKVNCLFANEMSRRGHTVAMFHCDDKEGAPFFPLGSSVQCYNLQHYGGKHIKYPLCLRLKRELLRPFDIRRARGVNDTFYGRLQDQARAVLQKFQPDVIVAFQPASSKLLLSDIGTHIPVITMSHGDPEDYFHTYATEEIPALGKSAACQVLMPSFAEAITRRFPDMKTVVIGNVVDQYGESANLAVEKPVYKIIFVGRLVKNHKQPHLLIEAFARVAKQFPAWQVEIWGGESRREYTRELEKLIRRYGLAERVFLKGVTTHVEEVLSAGDLFVFPSAYEGFGLAPAEAMSKGLPVIAYRSCAAVNELVRDGVTGLLCEDGVEPLAAAMKKLMSDRALRVQMGGAARESMRQYAPDRIWSAWENLINEAVAGRARRE